MMKEMIGVVLALCAGGAGSQQVSIFTIGDLPGDNTISHASDVSADGSVVIGNGVPAGGGTASFRWTADTGIVEVPGVPGGSFYESTNLSPSGNYMVGRYTRPGGGGALSYIWSESTGTLPLGDLPGGAEYTLVNAVSENGVAVGSSTVGVTNTGARLNRAARWTASGGLEALPLPDPDDVNFQSQAIDILADGRVLGSSNSGVWLYDDTNGFEMLTDAAGVSESNSDASFMIANRTNFDILATGAMYWTPDTGAVFLPLLDPGNVGRAFGMSADGSVIVGEQGTTDVVWIDQGDPIPIEDFASSIGIDMTGWTITRVIDVSADGKTIVGTAYRDDWFGGGGPSVRLEAFVMRIGGSCAADVNNDGSLTSTDFTAWIGAFNNGLPACDQNNDGSCTPTDFTAWVANYNAGC